MAVDLDILGSCIDTTFGRSSTGTDPSRSVTVKVGPGNVLTFSYLAIVNTIDRDRMPEVIERSRVESESLVRDVVTKVKKEYKELGGGALKLTERSDTDGLELITGSYYNMKRMSYYRRRLSFDLG